MNTIGKNGVKVVERHLVTQELNDEMKARLESVENRRPEVRREEMSDALHRVALLEKQVGHLQYDLDLHKRTDGESAVAAAGSFRWLMDRVSALEGKPAQVLRETTVEKPGVTVHEHTIERVPHTDKWVWIALSLLALAQAAQVWRLL
jgi:hypothetical protein